VALTRPLGTASLDPRRWGGALHLPGDRRGPGPRDLRRLRRGPRLWLELRLRLGLELRLWLWLELRLWLELGW
jgi:hypothetical protein